MEKHAMKRLSNHFHVALLGGLLFVCSVSLSPWAVADALEFERQTLIERHLIELEGVRNFRDLGGFQSADGRRVLPGRLYRSAVLHPATAADFERFDIMGIRTIVDLRSTDERALEPTDWPYPAVLLAWDYDLQLGSGDFMVEIERKVTSGSMDGAAAEALMVNLYREMVDQQRPHFQRLFEEMLEGKGPLLFHCTAGKDRTGLAGALILTALGVDRDTIMLDYTLSETIASLPSQEPLAPVATADGDGRYAALAAMPPDAIAALMGTRRVYLESAFEEMRQRYGSVEAYIRNGLKVSDADLRQLRDLYLGH